MRSASAYLYALIVLLSIVYIGMNTLHHNEIELDWLSNSHSKFQSLLDAQSISQMAQLCLENYGRDMCDFDTFAFDNSFGGYHLSMDKNGIYWAEVYVERKNLRTSQILRTQVKIPLKVKIDG